MKEKLKDDKFVKDLLMKVLFVLIIGAVALVLLDVLSLDKDGRKQIVSEGGQGTTTEMEAASSGITAAEEKLKDILGTMKGVGKVNVMITYRDDQEELSSVFSRAETREPNQVKGVIITAEGAGNPVVRNNIINAVSAVFDIPLANVMVFEKN